MASPLSSENDERVEQKLLRNVRTAEKTYRSASEEYQRIREEYGNLLDHPDGASALHNAAKVERLAIQKYSRALRAFADFVLCGRRPVAHWKD